MQIFNDIRNAQVENIKKFSLTQHEDDNMRAYWDKVVEYHNLHFNQMHFKHGIQDITIEKGVPVRVPRGDWDSGVDYKAQSKNCWDNYNVIPFDGKEFTLMNPITNAIDHDLYDKVLKDYYQMLIMTAQFHGLTNAADSNGKLPMHGSTGDGGALLMGSNIVFLYNFVVGINGWGTTPDTETIQGYWDYAIINKEEPGFIIRGYRPLGKAFYDGTPLHNNIDSAVEFAKAAKAMSAIPDSGLKWDPMLGQSLNNYGGTQCFVPKSITEEYRDFPHYIHLMKGDYTYLYDIYDQRADKSFENTDIVTIQEIAKKAKHNLNYQYAINIPDTDSHYDFNQPTSIFFMDLHVEDTVLYNSTRSIMNTIKVDHTPYLAKYGAAGLRNAFQLGKYITGYNSSNTPVYAEDYRVWGEFDNYPFFLFLLEEDTPTPEPEPDPEEPSDEQVKCIHFEDFEYGIYLNKFQKRFVEEYHVFTNANGEERKTQWIAFTEDGLVWAFDQERGVYCLTVLPDQSQVLDGCYSVQQLLQDHGKITDVKSLDEAILLDDGTVISELYATEDGSLFYINKNGRYCPMDENQNPCPCTCETRTEKRQYYLSYKRMTAEDKQVQVPQTVVKRVCEGFEGDETYQFDCESQINNINQQMSDRWGNISNTVSATPVGLGNLAEEPCPCICKDYTEQIMVDAYITTVACQDCIPLEILVKRQVCDAPESTTTVQWNMNCDTLLAALKAQGITVLNGLDGCNMNAYPRTMNGLADGVTTTNFPSSPEVTDVVNTGNSYLNQGKELYGNMRNRVSNFMDSNQDGKVDKEVLKAGAVVGLAIGGVLLMRKIL